MEAGLDLGELEVDRSAERRPRLQGADEVQEDPFELGGGIGQVAAGVRVDQGDLLEAASNAPNTIDVLHDDWGWGCCPEFDVTTVLTVATATIDATLLARNDFCDCICTLDATWRITEVPSGIWTVRSGVLSVVVEVP